MSGIVQVQFVGRLGNQLHQYCAARKYAEIVGARLETTDWIGRHVFDLGDPEWSRDLPQISDGCNGLEPSIISEWGRTNIRLGGYFQTQRWVGLLSRDELKRILTIKVGLLEMCTKVIPSGRYVAAHVRLGDYVGHPLFANVTEQAYIRGFRERGIDPASVCWVREDRPRVVERLPPGLAFLPDFVTLIRAGAIFRANSSFSWWAAVLSDAQIFAPVVTNHVGDYEADFVEGNWPRIADKQTIGLQIDDLHLPE